MNQMKPLTRHWFLHIVSRMRVQALIKEGFFFCVKFRIRASTPRRSSEKKFGRESFRMLILAAIQPLTSCPGFSPKRKRALKFPAVENVLQLLWISSGLLIMRSNAIVHKIKQKSQTLHTIFSRRTKELRNVRCDDSLTSRINHLTQKLTCVRRFVSQTSCKPVI